MELGVSHFLCFSPNSLSLGVLRTAHRLLLDLSCPQPAGSTGWGNPEQEGLSKEPQTKELFRQPTRGQLADLMAVLFP